jgi:hypothetical protein
MQRESLPLLRLLRPLRYAAFVPLLLLLGAVLPTNPQAHGISTRAGLEPAQFWAGTANNDKLEAWQRRVAIYRLFQRHVRKGMTLRELGEILSEPNWFRDQDVFTLGCAGQLPGNMLMTPGDTMLEIYIMTGDLLKGPHRPFFVICMNVSGDIDTAEFLSVVRHKKRGAIENAKLKEWAFSPTWAEYTKELPP